jgi:hypothetical protein
MNILQLIMFDVDIIVEIFSFVFSKVLQPQSVQKDVERRNKAGKML